MRLSIGQALMREGNPSCILTEQGSVGLEELRNQVARVQRAVPTGIDRVLLCSDCSGTFLIRLLALLGLGLEVVLPANGQPDTLAKLADEHQLQMDDHWQPADAPTGPVAWDQQGRLRLFTSGSSGDAKPVEKTLGQMEAELGALEQMFGSRVAGTTLISSVSHQHIYGLLFRVLWPFASGRPFLAQTLLYPECIDGALLRHAPAVLVASPSLLERWALDGEGVPHLAFSSGGPLARPAAMARAQAWGEGVVEIYGSTETGGIARRQAAVNLPDPAWQPFPGVETRVEAQRLQLRSAFIDPTSWYLTDDLVEQAGEGFVLTGRADRTVKLAEKRVNLVAMERALESSSLVHKAALVVLPARRPQLGAALELTDAGEQALADAGHRGLSERLKLDLMGEFERVTLPRRWRYRERLPYNSQGKLPRTALLELFDVNQD